MQARPETQQRLEEEKRAKAEVIWQHIGTQRVASGEAFIYEQNQIGDVRVRLRWRGTFVPTEEHHSFILFRKYQGDIWIVDPTAYIQHIDVTVYKIDGADEFRNFILKNIQHMRFRSVREIKHAVKELIRAGRKMPIY